MKSVNENAGGFGSFTSDFLSGADDLQAHQMSLYPNSSAESVGRSSPMPKAGRM
jgi:hypothetical protein